MLHVTTLKGPTCVAVLTDIRVTEKIARVSKMFCFLFLVLDFFYNFKIIALLIFKPLVVLRLVVKMPFVRKMLHVLCVSAILVSKVTDTTVQVG